MGPGARAARGIPPEDRSNTALDVNFRVVDPTRMAYIGLYYARKRKQDRLATEASNKWESRKAELVQRAIATGWDINSKKFRDLCDQDYALDDAMQAWSWHERESKRCEGVIRTELLIEAMQQATPPAPRSPAPAPRSERSPEEIPREGGVFRG